MEEIHFSYDEVSRAFDDRNLILLVAQKLYLSHGGNHAFFTKLVNEIEASISKLVYLYKSNPDSRSSGCNRITVYVTAPKAGSVSNSSWTQQINV